MSVTEDEIKPEDIHTLLEHFVKTSHKVKDGDLQGEFIMERCMLLLAKDYHYSVITNFNGELCGHYPSKIILLEYQKTEADRQSKRQQDVQSLYNTTKLRDLIKQAKYARCRSRFVVPVILCEGKHVCRSATLSGGPELYGRQGLDFLFSGAPGNEAASSASGSAGETQMFDRIRGQDIQLLKEFSIKYICDLMVEKKKVKFYMNITSSEKVDKENRYNDFNILTMPYPGCEFFKEWKDNSYLGERMTFDWSQNYVDAELDIPEDRLLNGVRIDWKKYRDWDLINLTKNYIKLLLQILRGGDSGILVHCISGWDRTPLFISLLRLSLWADGLVHASLSATEILYLTLAYDWYLFGHNLADRVNKGEEILFFCFNFLANISGEEFSIKPNKEGKFSSRTNSECNIEGVLLDSDNRRNSYRGSNTSISSVGSSIVEHPLTFCCHSTDEDAFLPHVSSNGQPAIPHSLVSQSPRHSLDGATQANHLACKSSSPMAVPLHTRKSATEMAARANSPACGSWQVISSSGSLRGYVTSSDSPLSLGSDSSSGRLSACQEAIELPETSRWKKLDSVRKIFHNAYANKIFSRGAKEGGGIGNLLDQFAEKVGIRNRNTFV